MESLVDPVRSRLDDFEALATWFDLDEADLAEAAVAARGITQDDRLVRQVADSAAILLNHMNELQAWGVYEPPVRYDPRDADAPLAERLFYLFAYASVVPELLDLHARRGIDEAVTRETLADVGQHVRLFRQEYGRAGLLNNRWLQAHMRGVLVGLGRLQFNVGTYGRPLPEAHALGVLLGEGERVLDTHIPGTGPLTPEACDASFGRARPFFAEHFPEIGPVRYVTCDSWLLDGQLPALVPGSNIASFQQRWRLFGDPIEADASALNFIFHSPLVPRAELPRRTRLQRAVLDHLDAGGHIYQRYGITELP